jgi:hypothetical protein
MRINRFTPVFAGLFAVMIGTANVSAEQAAGINPQEQTIYQTKGIVIDAMETANWVSASYWEQKIGEIFRFALDPRMQADPEERDAVLATAWQLKPEAVKAETKIVAVIPKRPAKPQSKDITYQITFIPRTNAQEKDTVEARFFAEGPAARPIATSLPADGVAPRWPSSYSYAGFPKHVARYWAEHRGEMNSILTWIYTSAGPAFDQILPTKVVEGAAVRSACFHVMGTKAAPELITSLSIVFLGDVVPVTSELPAYYNARDFADLQIEKIQTEAATQDHDKLGAVTGIAELPAEERLPAKAAIWQYFKHGTRNAEIDAIVPIPNTDKRALLTLRFGANNNVSVQRIGEHRKGTILGQLGDVRRVNGFGANSADVPALMAWLKKRYPAVTPKGITVTELANSATAEIQTRSGTPGWFKENYGIDILTASAAQSQLARLFQYKAQQLADLQDFTPPELQMLEVTLEKMGDHLVSRFKGLQMARQKAAVELIGVTATKFAINNPAEAGVALRHGPDRLITIFDSANLNSESLFVGGISADGKPEVAAETLMAFAHELGHMVAAMPGMKEAFEGLVKTKKIKPVTWYSASNPKDEFFPEAFTLYIGDPEWLKANRPDLFRWFDTLRDTPKS